MKVGGSNAAVEALKSFLKHAQITLSCSVRLNSQICKGCQTCYDVCPVGCFYPSRDGAKIHLRHPELCIACGACQLQCPHRAVQLLPQ
ncbi:MAG: hypothetical protein B6I34_02700 [Anaerolineaceae bacterium 4572_32.1]|nr:MAG: hypothetical protein B6I34_02700 [Anaerolineaceae bacterium 4572_32.1]